jgi:hypothetical protein
VQQYNDYRYGVYRHIFVHFFTRISAYDVKPAAGALSGCTSGRQCVSRHLKKHIRHTTQTLLYPLVASLIKEAQIKKDLIKMTFP